MFETRRTMTHTELGICPKTNLIIIFITPNPFCHLSDGLLLIVYF